MITELIKGSPNILGQIYKDLAQPSVRAVGSALGTVFEFSTSFLLPVKLLNEKIKLIFTKNLNDYKDKLEKRPLVLLIMGTGSLDRDGNGMGMY